MSIIAVVAVAGGAIGVGYHYHVVSKLEGINTTLKAAIATHVASIEAAVSKAEATIKTAVTDVTAKLKAL